MDAKSVNIPDICHFFTRTAFTAFMTNIRYDSSRIEQKLGPYKAPIPNGE